MNASTSLAAALAVALASFTGAVALDREVAVPANATLDPLLDYPAAICSSTSGRPRLLQTLVLAQRGETRPFPAQPVKAADGAPPLYDNLGGVSLKAGTDNTKAQAYFDQGLR